MKFYYIIFWLSLCFYGNAMTSDIKIEGIVKDAANQQPLSYVNIGIVNTETGTVTAPDGSFTLYLTAKDTLNATTILISYIGYEDYTVAISDAIQKESIEFFLTPSALTIKAVQVNAAKLYPKTKGYTKTKTRMNVSFLINKKPNQNLGAAVAKKFKAKKKQIYLDTLGFFIRQNNFDTVRFRVNIHKIENGKPGAFLHNQEIIVELRNRYRGWVEVDLRPYNLTSKEDIIASVEWVYHSKRGRVLQMPMAMGMFGHTHYYRYGSQNKWKKFASMTSAMYLKMKTE